jgi:CubicO group peptidase (beta-lactamase class C family)
LELIDNYLAELQEGADFNGAVLFAERGVPLLANTYGFTDRTGKDKLTTRSSFRLASVSKQFTAAGVLRATELGLLRLDEPITTYIKSPYPEVTVRHLLNHTSGIPDAYMDLAKTYRDSIGDVLSISDVIKLVDKNRPAITGKPGDAFSYSNTNYVLLAGIIESVASKSFEEFMQAEIFAPLDMENSRVFNLNSSDSTFTNKTGDFFAIFGWREPMKPTFLDGVAGDGNVYASIEDLLKWDAFWRGGNGIVSDSLLQQAFLKPILNDGSTSNYGFGWQVTKTNQRHDGSWLGARTIIIRNPELKTVFVLLDNSTNLRFDAIVGELTKALRPSTTATDS